MMAGRDTWLICLLMGISILQMVTCIPFDPASEEIALPSIDDDLIEVERESRGAEETIDEYLQKCSITYSLGVQKLVKFTSPFYGTGKQYPPDVLCKLDFIGDAQCTPELMCKDFELAPPSDGSCDDEHLKVSDGLGGEEDMCGHKSFAVPIRASKGARDLFISFQSNPEAATGNFKGFSCQVSCSKNPAAAKELAPNDDVRKEEFGCICGLRNQDDRIVGGEDVSTMAEYPWQAAVVYTGTREPKCGAAVLNSRYVLTASHCFAIFDPTRADQVEVLIHAQVLDATTMQGASKDIALGQKGSLQASGFNDARRTDKDENTKRYKVAEVITHPLFTNKYDYDVAVLRLATEIDLKSPDSPTPICLPQVNYSKTYEGAMPTVVGWGLADENAGGTTRRLQKLDVPIIPLAKCQSWTGNALTERMICAGYEEGKKDACTGDSGGPLVYQKPDKQWEQIGVVSWGEGCARAHKPGIYSRVTDLGQWIRYYANKGAKWCRDSK